MKCTRLSDVISCLSFTSKVPPVPHRAEQARNEAEELKLQLKVAEDEQKDFQRENRLLANNLRQKTARYAVTETDKAGLTFKQTQSCVCVCVLACACACVSPASWRFYHACTRLVLRTYPVWAGETDVELGYGGGGLGQASSSAPHLTGEFTTHCLMRAHFRLVHSNISLCWSVP